MPEASTPAEDRILAAFAPGRTSAAPRGRVSLKLLSYIFGEVPAREHGAAGASLGKSP